MDRIFQVKYMSKDFLMIRIRIWQVLLVFFTITFGYCQSISINILSITSFRNKHFKFITRQFVMASNALKSNCGLHSLLTSGRCLQLKKKNILPIFLLSAIASSSSSQNANSIWTGKRDFWLMLINCNVLAKCMWARPDSFILKANYNEHFD